MRDKRSSSPGYPEAQKVGEHLVIDLAEWVPGRNPEPHRRRDGQSEYLESYFRCLRCEVERLRKSKFPEECDARGAPDQGEGDADTDADADPREQGPPQL